MQVILHYPDEHDGGYATDPGCGKSMSCTLQMYVSERCELLIKYYSQDPERISRVSFDTKKLKRKHREVFALLSFIPDKEEFSFIWVQFQFIRRNP